MICSTTVKRPPSLTRRAVERRVKRRLAHEGLILRKCSPRSRWYGDLGDYYLMRIAARFTVVTHGEMPPGPALYLAASHLHLDYLARDYGVIGDGEVIAGE